MDKIMSVEEPLDMHTIIRTTKADLRKAIGVSLKTLSQDDIRKQSLVVHSILFSLPEYQEARNLSLFLSMPSGEILTKPIVKHAFDHGKSVFIPYICKNQADDGPRSVMDMVQLHSIEDFQQLTPDKWGIPSLDSTSLPNRQRCLGGSEARIDLDLIIMPGLAFDKHLQRIGHGKGYYDFFLKRYSEHARPESKAMPFLVALALQQQVLPDGQDVPIDKSDWAVDALVVGDGSNSRRQALYQTISE